LFHRSSCAPPLLFSVKSFTPVMPHTSRNNAAVPIPRLRLRDCFRFEDGELQLSVSAILVKLIERRRVRRLQLARKVKKTRRPNLDRHDPRQSNWCRLYVDIDEEKRQRLLDRTTVAAKEFQTRFRMWYSQFVDFMAFVDSVKPFEEDGFGRLNPIANRAAPLQLYVLGALRILGRHWTFDDLSESTFISRERHRTFFHKFIAFGASLLFAKYVRAPATPEEVESCMYEYDQAGFPGCIGSVDSTYIWHLACSAGLRNQMHAKEARAVVRVEFVVNHRGKILSCTDMFKGIMNDKSIANFDDFIQELKRGDNPLYDKEFITLDANGTETKERGLYLLCDGGYNKWKCLMTGDNSWSEKPNVAWRAMLESLRKDVECVNGILKARWKILQSGIRLHEGSAVQQVVHTCVALHNMLLDANGLDERFDHAEEPTVQMDRAEADRFRQLEKDFAAEEIAEGMKRKGAEEEEGFKPRRKRLIEHFTYKRGRREIKWMSRSKPQQM